MTDADLEYFRGYVRDMSDEDDAGVIALFLDHIDGMRDHHESLIQLARERARRAFNLAREKETRHLTLIRKLTMDERTAADVRELERHNAALIAEVGTLKAELDGLARDRCGG